MPSPKERQVVLRKFDGVMQLVDQAFLGPSYLRASQNWIPGETFRLTKTPGNVPFAGGPIPATEKCLKLFRTYNPAGDRYLYAVATPSAAGGDQLWVSFNDAVWTRVQLSGGGDAGFAERGSVYDIAELNGILYVGNGIDPIYSIPVGGTATALTPITAFTDGSAAPTLIVATAASSSERQMLTGTYSYAWAIYDNTANRWVERGQTREVTLPDGTNNAIEFPTPTGMTNPLSAQFRAHLFVAPLNLPVEFGHDQNPEGASAAGTVVVREVSADGPPLPLRGAARTGCKFRAHRGRLWISGDQANPTAVWATYLVIPGLEQEVFNAGLFFPFNARLPRPFQYITSIGLGTKTGSDDPEVPLIVCTLSATWLYYGDILDDPSAAWLQVSRTIGCIEHETMVETPMGTFFVGLQSVYMVPPGGGAPVDVGWPIRPAITAIPPNQRSKCRAIYHKGFLKVAIVPPGQADCVEQWWLDLRQGVGQVPSWWGPSPRRRVDAWTVGQQDPAEPDRGFMAGQQIPAQAGAAQWDVSQWDNSVWDSSGGGASVELIHQQNVFTEFGGTVTLISTLQTGDLDDNKPFDRKMVTRIRVTAFPGAQTSIAVSVAVDAGTAGQFSAMALPAPPGAFWNQATWDVSQWGQNIISEGESVAPTSRPRGRTASVQLVHSEAKALSIRDFELRYLPVDRPVRLLPGDPNS